MNKRSLAKLYREMSLRTLVLSESIKEIDIFLETLEEALLVDGEVIAEVWIEMLNIYGKKKKVWVTSFAEVWIEISARAVSQRRRAGHFLRGSVD